MTDVDFDTKTGRLVEAAVQNVNGYYSFNCLFTDGVTSLIMGSGDWAGWKGCVWASQGGNASTAKCDPSADAGCKLWCPSKPKPDSRSAPAGCRSDRDCNHAGTCQADRCVCDAPFHGDQCQNFTLFSVPPGQGGFESHHPNLTTSWGGSVVEADDGSFHMFAAMFTGNGTLATWLTQSVVGHAVSKTGPAGPYIFSDIALGPRPGSWDGITCHNPDVQRTPEGLYLIYYMGSKRGGPVPPAGHFLPHPDVTFNQRIGMAWSHSPYGPWHRLDQPILEPGEPGSWDDGFTTNPASYVYPNGSVLLIYKARSREHPQGMFEGLAFAEHWNGTYRRMPSTLTKPLDLDPKCEDAGIYRSPSGVFRMLTHCGCDGQYMWSLDGIAWRRTTERQGWCSDIEYTDGTRGSLVTRQRPKWLVDHAGVATHVFTGVNRPGDTAMGHTWTMAASVRHPALARTQPRLGVAITVGGAIATTEVSSLTSVTMDVCLAKQRFPFDDPTFLALTRHLGGGAAILRIGGSDQNTFFYAPDSNRTEPFSAATGGPCCSKPGSCHGCVKDCTMPGPYWKKMVRLAEASGHRFLFGLVPELSNATQLVEHSAAQGYPVYGYTYGNEQDKKVVIEGYPPLRKLLDDPKVFPKGKRPLLAGPDLALQRHGNIDEAWAGHDASVNKQLDWLANFTSHVGSSLDVVSWHTYDFHTEDFGAADHATVTPGPLTHRLWNTTYLDYVTALNRDVTRIAARFAPQAGVWLSESDSVCHQGTDGVTNAFLNSVWLINRYGLLASQNVTVMARQSLVGYNYSLLSNWPVEPISPNPDYFTTILFRRLVGNTVLATNTNTDEGISTAPHARAFAFCAGHDALPDGSSAGAITLAMVNLDQHTTTEFKFDPTMGTHHEYRLEPGPNPVAPGFPWSSRKILLNGELLVMANRTELPPAMFGPGTPGREPGRLVLAPLTAAFAVFPDAKAPECG